MEMSDISVKNPLALTVLAVYHKVIVYVFSSRCKPLLIVPGIVTQDMNDGIIGAIAILIETDSYDGISKMGSA